MNKQVVRIIVTAVLLAAAYAVTKSFALPLWAQLLVFLVPYILISYDIMGEALEGICRCDPFDENFLMFIATIGALAIGFLPGAAPEFLEAVFVMLFFRVGELFEDYAEDRSRASIGDLMDIRPDTATVVRGGEAVVVSPQEVSLGETIIIKPGEKVALDGVITDGTSELNTTALTGESSPRAVSTGDEILSGCVNISGLLRVEVRKTFGESTVAKILSLVENSMDNKSRSETFIRRFAKVYTPIVVCLAVVLAFVPPFFCATYMAGLATWGYRALAFLVVSCPCALVLSVPLTFFAGIGCASREGILIKGGNYMEALAKVDTIVMDKTGTLTQGSFAVESVHPAAVTASTMLQLAATAEQYSTHPLAEALRREYGKEIDTTVLSDVREVAGQGLVARINGKEVCVGNAALMAAHGVLLPADEEYLSPTGTIIHVAVDGVYGGHIAIADQLKTDAADALTTLRALGVRHMVMLTGDNAAAAAAVAQMLHIDEWFSGLLPADKVAQVERLLEAPATGTLLFVGDGINDAPVLARADVGIAMGALGSDAAIEAADVVLMDDKLSKIATSIRIARHTIAIARQNTYFAVGLKVLILLLVAAGALGTLALPIAVFGDVGVMVLAVLNAMRALKMRGSH